jgi:glycosyltransferase involved in cell wall biosynthesis
MTDPETGAWQSSDTHLPAVSVVIAAFTMNRWDYLQQAVTSVRAQTVSVLDTIIAVDHNAELVARVRAELPGVTAIPSTRPVGSSGTRNSGAAASQGEIVVFLDDDIIASSHWLETVLPHFANPDVVGVGGRADPLWENSPPAWFPSEFYWVIGASYLGMPEGVHSVRNVWSSNMAMRKNMFEEIGGFRDVLGKVKERPRSEDTDLCLRAIKARSRALWLYEPAGVAGHRVPAQRAKFAYFLYRCFYEGSGKAVLAATNGLGVSTSVERRYMREVLPAGVAHGIRDAFTGDIRGVLRILAIMSGLSAAMAGFLVGGVAGILLMWTGRRKQSHASDVLDHSDCVGFELAEIFPASEPQSKADFLHRIMKVG